MDTATTVESLYGPIPVSGMVERFDDGGLKSCTPNGAVVFRTALGPLAAQHSTDDLRRRTVQSLSFHPGGALRALPLEQPTRIATPAGPMDVELVTFHPDGSLSRAFPLNGKLSGYWTQEDEGRLAQPVELATPLGLVRAKLIGVSFAPGGQLLSLTLWPGETLEVQTPVGPLSARVGISFRADGTLRSLEPAKPQGVPTPAGLIQAYDLDAVGICGDVNSLGFAPGGGVSRISTSLTSVMAWGPREEQQTFTPATRESLCGDTEREPVPMRLEFQGATARIRNSDAAPWTELDLTRWKLKTQPYLRQFANPFGRMSCSC
ncbi:hypothetical protein [Humidesulfovibrio sp.]